MKANMDSFAQRWAFVMVGCNPSFALKNLPHKRHKKMTPAELALLGIDSETILLVWTWGFGSVLSMWALGFGVGVAVETIKKV
jgi:hypothetical protein